MPARIPLLHLLFVLLITPVIATSQANQYFTLKDSLTNNIDLQNKFDETYFRNIDSFAKEN